MAITLLINTTLDNERKRTNYLNKYYSFIEEYYDDLKSIESSSEIATFQQLILVPLHRIDPDRFSIKFESKYDLILQFIERCTVITNNHIEKQAFWYNEMIKTYDEIYKLDERPPTDEFPHPFIAEINTIAMINEEKGGFIYFETNYLENLNDYILDSNAGASFSSQERLKSIAQHSSDTYSYIISELSKEIITDSEGNEYKTEDLIKEHGLPKYNFYEDDVVYNKEDFLTVIKISTMYSFILLAERYLNLGYTEEASEFMYEAIKIDDSINLLMVQSLATRDKDIARDYIDNASMFLVLKVLFSIYNSEFFEPITFSEKIKETQRMADNLNLEPEYKNSLKAVKILLDVFADMTGKLDSYSSTEKFSEWILEVEKDLRNSLKGIWDQKTIDLTVNSILKEYASKVGNMLGDFSKDFLEDIEKDPKNAKIWFDYIQYKFISYYNDGILGDGILGNTLSSDFEVLTTDQSGIPTEFFNLLDNAINTLFEDVKIKDIQNEPELFSTHMAILKFKIMIDAFGYDASSFPEFSSYDDPQTVLFGQMLRTDKINRTLVEKNNNQLFLDYFNDIQTSKETEDIVKYLGDLMYEEETIVYYSMIDNGGRAYPMFKVFIIQGLEKNDNFKFDSFIMVLNKEYYTDLSDDWWIGDEMNLNVEKKINLLHSHLKNNINNQESIVLQKDFYKLFFEVVDKYIKEEGKTVGLLNLGLAADQELWSNKKNRQSVTIIKDSMMDPIPFGVMIDQDGDYLAQKYHISYANSLYEYSNLAIEQSFVIFDRYGELNSRQEAEKALKRWNPKLVVFGDIDYEKATNNLPYRLNLSERGYGERILNLKWSKNEIDWIKSVFKNELVYSSNQATETNLKDLDFSGIDYLHFSTHGISSYQDYSNSSLLLAPDSMNDGFLSYKEVLNLDLKDIELVFLSACDTNIGKNFRNINALSLQSAFKSVGVNSVISTLWPIDDEGAAEFAKIFYKFLSIGKDPNGALQITKQFFIHKNSSINPKYRNPYYWAAFVNYGGG